MPKKLTQEEFIARAQKVWGDKFDLSKVAYKNQNTKIEVICPKHGPFFPQAGNFLAGHGCPGCGREKTEKAQVRDTAYFIKLAREVHGDRYDYSRVNYRTSRDKVEIICPVHGSFFQRANDHTSGKGCQLCAGTKKYTTEEFIKKAREEHRDKYDYSLVEYKGNKKKVAIICPDHGLFWQVPNSHLLGRGCPVCQETYGERDVRYFLEDHSIPYKKEYRFPDCKDRVPLRFDFYLPGLNTCIEFQGKQHYKDEPFFDSAGGFLGRVRRDKIKKDFCKAKGIRLVEIKYTDNIQNELTKTLL